MQAWGFFCSRKIVYYLIKVLSFAYTYGTIVRHNFELCVGLRKGGKNLCSAHQPNLVFLFPRINLGRIRISLVLGTLRYWNYRLNIATSLGRWAQINFARFLLSAIQMSLSAFLSNSLSLFPPGHTVFDSQQPHFAFPYSAIDLRTNEWAWQQFWVSDGLENLQKRLRLRSISNFPRSKDTGTEKGQKKRNKKVTKKQNQSTNTIIFEYRLATQPLFPCHHILYHVPIAIVNKMPLIGNFVLKWYTIMPFAGRQFIVAPATMTGMIQNTMMNRATDNVTGTMP